MNARIAKTLMEENQYSTVPKALTLNMFTPMSTHREQHDPQDRRHGREPELQVVTDGGDLGADSQHDSGPVQVSRQESCEREDVVLGKRAEGSGSAVGNTHLCQGAH